ncbi:MAG: fumarate hydratase C-terminal domain-containing protein [Methanocorpusculum sp.]|nr:fumarate hydratase C-terminal domain-containing protein [Methanocorpusculum sp.]
MRLTTPLSDEVLSLNAGDRVLLSGTVYTARDEAHLKILEEGFPFNPMGAVLYHCGPVISGGEVVAAGPTTSARMNKLTKPMLDAGVCGLIGKGGMSDEVVEALRGRGVYFAFTGGCAALAASCMKLKGVHYAELGMAEAVWEIELSDMPLVVGIDSKGNNLFKR